MPFPLLKKISAYFGVFILLFSLQTFFSNADVFETNFDKNGEYVEGQVLVKLDDERVSVDSFAGKMVINIMEVISDVDTQDVFSDQNLVLMTGNGESTQQMMDNLNVNPFVEYVEPNYVRRLAVSTPNDTGFSNQWGLNNSGQIVNGFTGTADADIDAPEAYDLATGGTSVIVAVLDTGVLATHEDLVDNLWDGSAGCNDENNVAIIGGCPNHGYDFSNNDNNPADDHGHGTFVSGVVGAKGNNAKGVTGVSQTAKIMEVKFLDAAGTGSVSDEIKAINFAKNNGATIINASFAGDTFSQVEKDAIDAFPGLFIAAAGNGGGDQVADDNDLIPVYPASYTSSNIIAVAATDKDDALTSFSNFGLTSVDLAAPGKNIYSTSFASNTSYSYGDGTSASAPFVSGAASLLWNYNSSLTVAQVKSILLSTGDSKAGLAAKMTTDKRLNIFNALSIFNPIAGYAADNVIPANQISQSTDGAGVITIPFRVKDGISGLNVILNSFEYSVDGGATFNAPTNGDDSAALSASWVNNSYLSATDYSSTVFTFTLNTKHADLAGFTDIDQSDVMVRFKANDGVLTSPFVVSEAFRVDLVSPDVTGLIDDAIVSMSKVWTWDSTDVGATFRFSIDQSVDGVATGSFSSSETTTYDTGDGTFYIHVQSSDPFGNQSVVSTASFIMDHTGAEISGISNDIVPAATKTWNWSSDDVGATFRYAVDQILTWPVPVGEYGADLTASQLTGDGTYYLHVQSKDLTGVESAVTTVSVILDNSAPVITGITNDETITNSKVWSFSSTDLSSVVYRFVIDQDVNGLPTGDYAVQASTTHSTGDETFYIHLQAQDSLGHVSTVATASFVMDTTVPSSVTLSGIPDSTTTTSVDVTVSGSEATHYQYEIDGGEFSEERLISQHIILSGLSVATHTFTVKGRDAAGNYQTSNTTASWTVTAPVVVAPSGGGGGGGGGGSSKPKVNKDPVREITTIPVSPVTVSVVTPFADTVNHWSSAYVEKLHELGVVEGKGSGSTFAPDDNLSRAELTKIALLTFSYKDFNEEYNGFKDVRTDLWYYPFIVKAFVSSIINGYLDGTFHPDSPVTRSESLKILLLAAKVDLTNVNLQNPFSDIRDTDWYAPYVYFAFNAGIVNGKSEKLFAPNDFVTRGEMAKMAVETLNYVTGVKP